MQKLMVKVNDVSSSHDGSSGSYSMLSKKKNLSKRLNFVEAKKSKSSSSSEAAPSTEKVKQEVY